MKAPSFLHHFSRFLKPFVLLIFLTLFLSVSASGTDAIRGINHLLTSKDAVLLANPTGDIIYSLHVDKKLIPASTLKLLTSLAAIHYLGKDYRFPTDFFVDSDKNLTIKGYGDPLLISEEIDIIAKEIKSKTSVINHIILDDTFFKKPLMVPGTTTNSLQPYDAPNGALCVNFNTVNFKSKNGNIVSAEPQTPIVAIARGKIIESKLTSGRILFTDNGNEITRYAGQIFQYFLKSAGIEIKGKILLGAMEPGKDRLIYRHESPFTLSETISRLLEYSNNFMANQLLLCVGARVSGPPATIDKGVRAAKTYFAQNFDISDLSYVEGSGISRQNHLTARLFHQILSKFKPYHDLMQHQENEYYKTGTLDGIRTRAGYIVSSSKELYPFVVLLNAEPSNIDVIMEKLKKQVP